MACTVMRPEGPCSAGGQTDFVRRSAPRGGAQGVHPARVGYGQSDAQTRRPKPRSLNVILSGAVSVHEWFHRGFRLAAPIACATYMLSGCGSDSACQPGSQRCGVSGSPGSGLDGGPSGNGGAGGSSFGTGGVTSGAGTDASFAGGAASGGVAGGRASGGGGTAPNGGASGAGGHASGDGGAAANGGVSGARGGSSGESSKDGGTAPDAGDAGAAGAGEGCALRISAGGEQTCALKRDGTAWCWGNGTIGELGDGMAEDDALSPVQVVALGNTVADVVAGPSGSCALKQDGTLWCWGDNGMGEIGDGTQAGSKCTTSTVCRPVPTKVLLDSPVSSVALGADFTCAVGKGSAANCWGFNSQGSLGDGSLTGYACNNQDFCELSPTPVAIDKTVVQVGAGSSHACALKSNGTVWCWGNNDLFQLSVVVSFCPSQSMSYCTATPVQVSGLGNTVKQIAVGGAHNCALKMDGSLWCWGYNQAGELGEGMPSANASSCGTSLAYKDNCEGPPVSVTALGTNVVEVAAGSGPGGSGATCARTRDGAVWCWGNNDNGQLGIGSNTTQPSPVRVTGLPRPAKQISVGYNSTACAVLDDGSPWCWGINNRGQLGDGTTMDRNTPVRVKLCP